MYNVQNSITGAIMAIILSGALFASCSSDSKPDPELLLGQTQTLIDSRDFAQANVLIDSIHRTFPDDAQVRLKAMRMTEIIKEALTIDSISAADIRLAEAQLAADSLAVCFTSVENTYGVDPYFIPEGVDKDIVGKSTVQPRISADGNMYMVASYVGANIGLKAVGFSSGTEKTTSDEVSGDRCVKDSSSELVSFSPEEVMHVADWLIGHPEADKILFIGSQRTVERPLSVSLKKAISLSRRYALARSELRAASVQREKLERRLAIARDHIANMPK